MEVTRARRSGKPANGSLCEPGISPERPPLPVQAGGRRWMRWMRLEAGAPVMPAATAGAHIRAGPCLSSKSRTPPPFPPKSQPRRPRGHAEQAAQAAVGDGGARMLARPGHGDAELGLVEVVDGALALAQA